MPPAGIHRKVAKKTLWQKAGGDSLSISLAIHAVVFVAGLIWIFQVIPPKRHRAEEIDFLPRGGGGGTPDVRTVTSRKPMAVRLPPISQRITAQGAAGTFKLPDPEPASRFPSLASLRGGSLSGGLGGGGRGNGNGRGFGNGSGAGLGGNGKNIAMFGLPIGASTIGLVLDVSGSMTGHLPRVVRELDRVAPGSPLVMFAGCGITSSSASGQISSTQDRWEPGRFQAFWQGNSGGESTTFNILKARPNSYYVSQQTERSSSAALLALQLDGMEAIYWFSDFQDPVDVDKAKEIALKLQARKQKLYIHPTVHGRFFELVKENIVIPTGGRVMEPP